MAVFKTVGERIDIENKSDETIEVVLFGGEPYREAIVMGGPFVMSDMEGMERAYRDFQNENMAKLNDDNFLF